MGDEPVTTSRGEVPDHPYLFSAFRTRYTAALRQLRTPAGAVLAAGALGQVMTDPGQTAALSVFIDPIIAALDVSRSAVSAAYLCATLVGACALPWSGAVGVGSSAFGPILLAAGQAGFGSYTPIIVSLLAVPAAVALGLLLAPTPAGAPPPPGGGRRRSVSMGGTDAA